MPAGRQLNIRLSAAARDRLEALAFVRRTPSSTLARDILLDYLHRYQDEPGLEAALVALAEHDAAAAREADLARIDMSARRSNRSDETANQGTRDVDHDENRAAAVSGGEPPQRPDRADD